MSKAIQAFQVFLAAVFLNALLAIIQPMVETLLYSARLVSRPVPERLTIPVATASVESLRDSWHAPRGQRRHEGIDIFAARGTPVRTSTEGIIIRIGKSRLGGKVVWVLGPGGQRHYYAHLDQFSDVHPGQRIEAGALLGYVGNTGNARATPPHLHYGIYTYAGAVNPYPLLRKAARADGGAPAAAAKSCYRSTSRKRGPTCEPPGMKEMENPARY